MRGRTGSGSLGGTGRRRVCHLVSRRAPRPAVDSGNLGHFSEGEEIETAGDSFFIVFYAAVSLEQQPEFQSLEVVEYQPRHHSTIWKHNRLATR